MKLVKDVMVSNIINISPFATLREALSLMKRHNVKSLVVDRQNENDAWGLITYTNVLKSVVADSGDIDLLNVYDVCAKPVISVGEDLALKHAASLMIEYRVKRLLVLSNNELRGFVVMDDIMDALLDTID
ncbi:CBS domain-containing protein [Marinobacter sp.]|uniref:CBS domain-containing protein n=1 Tax=Marinobacter sp. TaxID=50741 RepID=UPI0035641D85